MANTKRIANIVTEFKANGVSALKKAMDKIAKAGGAVGKAIRKGGKDGKSGLDDVRQGSTQATTGVQRVAAVGGRLGQALTKASTTAQKAIQKIGTASGRVASQVGKLGSAGARMGSAVAKGALTAGTALARLSMRAGAVGTAIAAIGAAGFGGAIKKAVDSATEDMKNLNETIALTRMSPEQASFWQRFGAENGVEREDVSAIFGAFNTAAAEALQDPESQFAQTFKAMGIQVEGANGKLRDMSSLFTDLAIAQRRLAPQARGMFLAQIFGDGDSLKAGQMLDEAGRLGRGGLNSRFGDMRGRGELVDARQLAAYREYVKMVSRFKDTWRTVQRQVFTDIAPDLTRFFEVAGRVLRELGPLIRKNLVNGFRSFIVLLGDALTVFTGLDFSNLLGGKRSIQNTWLYDVKEVADALWASLKAVGVVLLELVRHLSAPVQHWFARLDPKLLVAGIVSASEAFVRFVAKARLLAIDLGTIFRELVGMGNGSPIFMTDEGGALFKTLQQIPVQAKRVFEQLRLTAIAAFDAVEGRIRSIFNGLYAAYVQPLVDQIRLAFAEAGEGFDAGAGLGKMSSTLAAIILALQYAIDYAERFVAAFDRVFNQDQNAPKGFEWLQSIRDGVGGLVEKLALVQTILDALLSPLNAILGLFTTIRAQSILVFTGIVLALATIANAVTFGLAGVAFGALRGAIAAAVVQIAGASGLAGAFATVQTAATTAFAAMGLSFSAFVAGAIVALGGLLIGLKAGQAIFDNLIAPALSERINRQTQDHIDRNVRPMIDNFTPKGAVAMAEYERRYGAFNGGAAASIDTSSVEVTAGSVNLRSTGRPTNIYFNGEQVMQTTSTDDQIARAQRSAAGSISR